MSLSVQSSMRSFKLSDLLSSKAGTPLPATTAEEEFLEIARKSPLERLRDKILEDMTVSEGALAQMEPEARQAVEDEIKRRMLEALQGSSETGSVVDKVA